MRSELGDLVVALTYPPTFSLALAAFGLLALLLRRRRVAVLAWVLAFGWTGVWSIPAFSDALRATLEQRHPVLDEDALPRADAIVVLGGAQHFYWMDREDVSAEDLPRSRVGAGARAWLAGRAPVVILSGGGAPGRTEARQMARAMQVLGVPRSALLLEERSRDTRQNALNTAELARRHGFRRVLLVTSALHMPRALRWFDGTGVEVVPVPVPETVRREAWHERWLPSRSALWRSGRALKEYAALATVRWQGRGSS